MLGPVEIVDEIDSTNRALLDRARAGAPHGVVLVADHQTAGRGRLDRRWEASSGSALLVSVLLRPDLELDRAHLVTFAAGLAAVEACEAVAAVLPALKWPNDVVVEEAGTRKLAGLLAESVVVGGRLDALVVGMGLNLRPVPLPAQAASLDELAGRPVDRQVLLDAWLVGFDRRLSADEADVLAEYRTKCSTIGRRVRILGFDRTDEGMAVDVDDRGRILVDAGQGPVAHDIGDVIHLRPTTK